jgi:predicted transcriptional regulator
LREFGQLESAIMDVLWAHDRALPVREVRERLDYSRPVAYTTVMTVLTILHGKGVLRREKVGRAWRYWPRERRSEHDARLMTEILRAGPDPAQTAREFLARLTADERGTLTARVDQPRKLAG